jgi:phosphate acyltransferase
MKGHEEIRDAARILGEASGEGFVYHGFVEGDDIGKGTVDVVVTEGFTGNIALKAAEGTARQIEHLLKAAMRRSIWSKLGYLLARGAFNSLKASMDPGKANGGVFLGLNGIVIKSHGNTNAEGFANAVDVGYDMIRHDLLARIGETLTREGDDQLPPRLIGGSRS